MLTSLDLDGTCFLAIKAVDDHTNEGPISNMAKVLIGEPEPDGTSSNVLAIVLGTLAAICIIAAIAGSVMYVRHTRRSENVTGHDYDNNVVISDKSMASNEHDYITMH